jgi:hypothetical protein
MMRYLATYSYWWEKMSQNYDTTDLQHI